MKQEIKINHKKLIIITESSHVKKLIKYIDENTTVIGWNQEVCQEFGWTDSRSWWWNL